MRYSVPEAARALGISERAVRKRIDAGTLEAVKDGRAWSVLLPTVIGAAHPAVPAAPVTVVAEPGAGTGPELSASPAVPDAAPASVDLAPLAELIERQASEIQRLTEAATTWQLRAGVLEQQLKQLTTGGDTSTDAAHAAPEPHHEAQPAERTSDTAVPWWKFWERWG